MKIQKIDFRFDFGDDSKTEQIELDKNYKRVTGLMFGYVVGEADPAQVQPEGTIEALSIDGRDGLIPKGFETVNMFATTNCPPELRFFTVDLPAAGAKLSATIKETTIQVKPPYVLKMYVRLEN